MDQVLETVKDLARQVVTSKFNELPGATTGEKEDAAVQWVIDRVESVDQLLPAIGQYMDLPIVDMVERFVIDKVTREAVRLVVRQQYAVMKIEKAVNA
ncbi:hypothetical protein E7T09_04505 [Deinococcus sp. KSM4-11]|uniref:hypothetical protein n=1 Tax=Deinococcus sp. KSM4-11 TaxID=2568654 RepID=UPI0010A340F5|nr:hypothetical protein [Deinococcus sp. KSM4-11]THF88472.1 hypothetical protein E7T09_04505 [Deinococcus sp. KSM4-11]